MKDRILDLINEQQSPLFRVMSVHNDNEPAKRSFDNNICASHIGNGYVLSVAHNLRLEAGIIRSIDEAVFQNEIFSNCSQQEQQLFSKCFQLDAQSNKRHINITDQTDIPLLTDALRRINYDTRWETLYAKGICKPYLIIQFKTNQFFNDAAATALFDPSHIFPEPYLNTHTFLIELELIKAYYAEDFSLYKVVDNTDSLIVNKIPSAGISYEIVEIGKSLYCLQGSPSGTNLGRMISESRIEGLLEHHAIEADRIGGPIFREGLRYLLKGYFRFGSSGAPYLTYDDASDSFTINAVQSEASPIQLSIKNNRDGNFQYVNAIATPLHLIQRNLSHEMGTDT